MRTEMCAGFLCRVSRGPYSCWEGSSGGRKYWGRRIEGAAVVTESAFDVVAAALAVVDAKLDPLASACPLVAVVVFGAQQDCRQCSGGTSSIAVFGYYQGLAVGNGISRHLELLLGMES